MKYADIRDKKRPSLGNRDAMSIKDRSAQFSPFAALTGHEEAVKEVARVTNNKINLDPYIKDEINRKLNEYIDRLKEKPKIKLTYFKKDLYKEGGTYLVYEGRLYKLDSYKKILIMEDGEEILIKNIIDIT